MMSILKSIVAEKPLFECKKCGRTGEGVFSWNGECYGCEAGDDELENAAICVDCPHQDACWDYGCGKELGVVDEEGNEI